MVKLFLICSLLLGFNKDTGCAKIDILVLVDNSKSVMGNEGTIADAVDSFIKGLDLDDNSLKLGIITFNFDAVIIHSLSSDKDDLLKSTSYIRNILPNGGTFMDQAFVEASGEFMKNGRVEANKIVIVISDGAPSQSYFAINELNKMKSLFSPLIFGILVEDTETNEQFMKDISSPGCYLETRYENLITELKRIDICI